MQSDHPTPNNIKLERQEAFVDFVAMAARERELIVDILGTVLAHAQHQGRDMVSPLRYELPGDEQRKRRFVELAINETKVVISEMAEDAQSSTLRFEVDLNSRDIVMTQADKEVPEPLLDNETGYPDIVTLSRIVFDCESQERRS